MNNLEPFIIDHPIDQIEPIEPNELREAALAYVRILKLCIAFISTAHDSKVAALGVSYALGVGLDGKSMRQKAREMGISSGTISRYSREFCRISGLPPSAAMKTEEHAANLSAARKAFLTKTK